MTSTQVSKPAVSEAVRASFAHGDPLDRFAALTAHLSAVNGDRLRLESGELRTREEMLKVISSMDASVDMVCALWEVMVASDDVSLISAHLFALRGGSESSPEGEAAQ